MNEVSGKTPGGQAPRVAKVYVREGGRVDLWVYPPGTPPDSKNGWAVSDLSLSELLVALGQAPTEGW